MSETHTEPQTTQATVLLIGGPDMDLRLELMGRLRSNFEMMVAGTAAEHQPKFETAGYKYFSYPLGRTVSPFLDLYSIAFLWRLCRRIRPDIVHTFDAKPGVWGRLAARWAGVPVVIGTIPGLGSLYARENLSTRLLRAIYQPLQTWVSHFSDLTTFQNHDDAQRFIAAGVVDKQKTKIIAGSGVPTNVYSPSQVSETARMKLKRELGIESNDQVVTMISRVIRTKGVLEFMAAAREINARHSNVRFLLIGPADDQSLDRLTAAELDQLQASVIWPGRRDDVPIVLAISDLFVFPSAYPEGIPRVLLEAASMGLPLITTNSPGCKEVVEHNVNGLLVPVHDPAALAQAILFFIEQPEICKRFGQMSRRLAVERFDLALIAEQTQTMYQQLLAKRDLWLEPSGASMKVVDHATGDE